MVQQGEAQNNDCLFVVVLLAVIIAPPPLKDASRYTSKHAGTHMHTLTYPQECIHTPAGMCAYPHTHKHTRMHPGLMKISTCAFVILSRTKCDRQMRGGRGVLFKNIYNTILFIWYLSCKTIKVLCMKIRQKKIGVQETKN